MIKFILWLFIGADAYVISKNGSDHSIVSNLLNNAPIDKSGIGINLTENTIIKDNISTPSTSMNNEYNGEMSSLVSNSPPLYWLDLIHRVNKNATDIIRTKKMTPEDLYGNEILTLYNESKKTLMQEQDSLGFMIYRIICLVLLVILLLSAILYQINRIFSIKIEFFPKTNSNADSINGLKKRTKDIMDKKVEAVTSNAISLNEYPPNKSNNGSQSAHE